MILASEETAGAELEASAGYGYNYGYAYADGYGDGYGAVSAAQSNYCAVCYSPTATLCAKFNAVHYCSGKCQIIHWRQDHKDECRPRPIKCDFDHKPSKQEKDLSCGSNLQDESSLQSKSAALPNGESKPVDSTEASKVKHSNLDAELKAESSSESSGTGFTGFSSSSTSNESSDDVSVCDSISANDSIARSRKADEVNAAAEAQYILRLLIFLQILECVEIICGKQCQPTERVYSLLKVFITRWQ